ncbi:hypothetical protein [Nocardiopsis suaedae]|uniref:WXG100 family type VII secretion target n=1 Tax=Nocardiopsis suaedae TaxID=3018444 RepID=A0ABT4TGC8_9ACTN|nr:hypothetical protein [Nocardiopsis suaedae]MDA2803769.1 hypothetical protein [Nocardiopsis suaedae]
MAKKIVVEMDVLDGIKSRLDTVKDAFQDDQREEAEGWSRDIGPSTIESASGDYMEESKDMFDRMAKFIKDMGEGIDQVKESFVKTDDELAKNLEGEEGG